MNDSTISGDGIADKRTALTLTLSLWERRFEAWRVALFLFLIVFLLAASTACGGSSIPSTMTNASGTPIAQPRADFKVDGKILFVKDGVIYVWNNGNVRNLTSPGKDFEDPAWSPDGRRIAAAQKGTNHSDLIILSADGKPERQLTKDLSNVSIDKSAWARRPAWSPDGTKIAYVTDLGTDNFALWITDPDGANHRHANYQPLGNGDVDSPSWSKDGKKLAFVTWWSGQGELYVLDSATGVVKKITDDNDGIYDPVWSPDGSKIAYAKRSNGKHDIWAIDSNGGREMQLTSLGTATAPEWSPDGQMVAFVADRGQGFDLYAVKIVAGPNGGAVATEAKQLTSGQNIDTTSGLSWAK